MDGKKIKVFHVEKSHYKIEAGESKVMHKELITGCKDQSLRITELQLAGKKRCTDTALLNGYKGDCKINL